MADEHGLPTGDFWNDLGTNFWRDGTPITFRECMAAGYIDESKRVDITVVRGVTVSTVWLGLDHGFGVGPPLIFETMVFSGSRRRPRSVVRRWRDTQWRWASETEALDGHDRIVAELRHDLPNRVERRARRRRLHAMPPPPRHFTKDSPVNIDGHQKLGRRTHD